MKSDSHNDSIKVLLVEDNPGDVRLIQEALKDGRKSCQLMVTPDGVEAWAFLNKKAAYAESPRPDIIWLDLNLPRMDGRELLAKVRKTPDFCCIPVAILSSSHAQQDIYQSYRLGANCFITKPVDLDRYFAVIQSLVDFWSTVAALPQGCQTESGQISETSAGFGVNAE